MVESLGRETSHVIGHVFIATSLDGYIARPDGDVDWLSKYASGDEDNGYSDFMASVDGLVMGRGTFEKVISFQPWPYDKPVVVMSRSLRVTDVPAALKDRVRISSLDPKELVANLWNEGWRRLYIDGGKVIQSFIRDGLIAELVSTSVPVLLGQGSRYSARQVQRSPSSTWIRKHSSLGWYSLDMPWRDCSYCWDCVHPPIHTPRCAVVRR